MLGKCSPVCQSQPFPDPAQTLCSLLCSLLLALIPCLCALALQMYSFNRKCSRCWGCCLVPGIRKALGLMPSKTIHRPTSQCVQVPAKRLVCCRLRDTARCVSSRAFPLVGGRQAANTQETWSKRASGAQVRADALLTRQQLAKTPEVGMTSVLRRGL